MKRIFLSSLALLLISSACLGSGQIIQTPIPPSQSAETAMTPTVQPEPTIESNGPVILQRGINMGNMLEAPSEGEWGLFVQENYFDEIKDAGFDFVRLPVRWNAHAGQSAPYTIEPAFFARVDQIIGWAMDRDLVIIVNVHHYEEMMTDPKGNEERFLTLWKQIAAHYKDYPSTVLFELLNEPNTQLDAASWHSLLNKALPVVRETNPARDVVIGPVQWNSADQLTTLDLPEDEHLIATFHYYSPFEFTHQGAEWVGDQSQAWLGTTWDETAAQKADVTRTFDSVRQWADGHNTRILLGEFGAYSKAPQDSRIRWTNFIAREAERHGFAWSYWEFASSFGAYDPTANIWRDDLLKALIP